MSEVKRWLLTQEFIATEEMARKIRETAYAMGVNTNRDGFQFKRIKLKEKVEEETLEERVEREADEKYREKHGLDFYGKPIVYPCDKEETS